MGKQFSVSKEKLCTELKIEQTTKTILNIMIKRCIEKQLKLKSNKREKNKILKKKYTFYVFGFHVFKLKFLI